MGKSLSQILMSKRLDLSNELKESQKRVSVSENKMKKKKKYLLQETRKSKQLWATLESLSRLYARRVKHQVNIKINGTGGLKNIANLRTYLKIKEEDLKRVAQILVEARTAIAKTKTQNRAYDENEAEMKEQSVRLNQSEDFARKKTKFYVKWSSMIPEVRQKIAKKTEEKDAVTKLIQEAGNKRNTVKNSMNEKTEKLTEIHSKIDEAEASEQDLKKIIKETTDKLKEQDKILKENTEQKAKWVEKLAKHLMQIHELSLKSHQLDDEILEADMKNLQKKAGLLDKNKILNASCAAKTDAIDQLDQELEAVNKELDEINEKLKGNSTEKLDEKINIAKETLDKIQGNRANTRTPKTCVGDWLNASNFPSGQISEIDWSLYSVDGISSLGTSSPDLPKKTPHSTPERPPSSRSSRSTRSSRGSRQSLRSAKVRRMTPENELCEVSSTYLED